MPPRAAGKDFALPTGVNGETQEQWVEAKEATKILFLIFSSAVDFSDKHENVVNTDISQCYGSDMQREAMMVIVESE